MRKYLCAIFLLCSVPAFTHAQGQVIVLKRAWDAAKAVGAFVAAYATEKVLDSELGLDNKKELQAISDDLKGLREDLTRQMKIDAENRAELKLQRQLIDSQISIVDKALSAREHPTKSEFEDLQAGLLKSLDHLQHFDEAQRQINENQVAINKRNEVANAARDDELRRQGIEIAKLRAQIVEQVYIPVDRRVMLSQAHDSYPSTDQWPALHGKFLTAGIGYGSIRTELEDSLSNENRVVWLGRLGWRYTPHFAIGFEGSYWEARTNMLDLADGRQMRVNDAMKENAGTVALPLYITASDKFPFTIYIGPGFAWESRDIVQVDSAGRFISRHDAGGSGFAWVAGAGFDFRLGNYSTLSILARGIRTKMDSASPHDPQAAERQPEKTLLSATAALTFYF